MAASSRHFRLRTVAPGVHVAEATVGGHALSNGTIVDLGGTTVVFDTMLTPGAAHDLGRAAERRTGRKPGFVVTSHYHGDHCRGNASFRPAHLVATARTRELILERGPSGLSEDRAFASAELAALQSGKKVVPARDRPLYEGWYGGILATPRRLRFPAPDVLVAPEVTLVGARRSLRVLTFGGGHSPSDVLAYLPEEKIVLLGDLVTIGYHPWLPDGDPAELVRILDRVLGLGVDQAVPGHGPVGGPRDIRRLQAYVRGLRTRARSLLRTGRSRADPEIEIPPPYTDWHFGDFYRENLEFVVKWEGRRTAR